MSEQTPERDPEGLDELAALDGEARREALWRVVTDEQARARLAEMLRLQRQARAAFGYARAEPAMRRSLDELLDRLHARDETADRPPRPRVRVTRWLLRAAAVMVMAASAFVAVVAWQGRGDLDRRLSAMQQAIQMPALTAAEMAGYRQIWESVRDGADQGPPWVLLNNGSGEFGYLPEGAPAPAGQRMMLLRCVVLSQDGQSLEELNLLLPAGRTVRLSLPAAGQLAGRPVQCDIAAEERHASLGLTVGDSPAGPVGVRGRVDVGAEASEIGRFQLDGQTVRVLVQVTPLS